MIQGRYTHLLKPGEKHTPPPSDDEEEEKPKDNQEYATFLK